ncbi:hypothetical protein IEQ34_007122 [Dendrobium chrysotoxum]|uniref:Uncharacterized protein n=1 Tax=Dendrobium chrysotoxum TaxID=161865 RepID=A0AAV7H602_DENCH|nr:hypothetical protein IEQ34_007122 [Dendrobium chrysotoxum]
MMIGLLSFILGWQYLRFYVFKLLPVLIFWAMMIGLLSFILGRQYLGFGYSSGFGSGFLQPGWLDGSNP